MSLQFWFPFNGNYNNQGLDDNNPIPSGTLTYADSEKLNKCAVFGSSYFNFPYYHAATNELSIAFWVNPQTPRNWSDIFSLGAAANRLEKDNSTSGYRWYSSSSLSLLTNGVLLFNLPSKQWNHIIMTADGSKVKWYVNGNMTGEYTQTATISQIFETNTFLIAARTTSGSQKYSGHINDFRIYDHALSKKEVSELAKGLIFHMPLNNNGMSGINLLKGNYSAITDANGTRSTGSAIFDTSLMALNDLIGKTITFSFDYSCTGDKLNSTGSCSKDRYGIHLSVSYVNAEGDTKSAYPCADWLEFTGTGRAIQTYTFPSTWQSINDFSVALQPYNKPAANSVHIWHLKNLKIEIGSKATAYSPNPNDLGIIDTDIEETSGYNQQGRAVKRLLIDSDSPRYNVSTIWSDDSDFIHIPNLYNENSKISEITITGWFKTNTLNNTYPNMFNLGNNNFVRGRINNANSLWSYWNIDGVRCAITTTVNTMTDNKWHHYAFSFNNGIIEVYFDGILKGTYDQSSKGTVLSVNQIVDWGLGGYTPTWEKFLGSQSDFRIYCTALSAEDIKELAEIRPGVDNLGNSYFASIEEEMNYSSSVSNTGIAMVSQAFYEDNIANFAYDTELFDYENVEIYLKPTAATNNYTARGFKVYYGGSYMQGKNMKIDLDVEWGGGFLFDTTQSNSKIYFQGEVILANNKMSWTYPIGTSNKIVAALNDAQDLTALVTSASSGTYHYSVIFTVACGTSGECKGHCVGLRANYSDGNGWIKLKNIKVTPLDACSTKDQSFKISEHNIVSNYIYEF